MQFDQHIFYGNECWVYKSSIFATKNQFRNRQDLQQVQNRNFLRKGPNTIWPHFSFFLLFTAHWGLGLLDYIIYKVLQCDLPPLRSQCGEAGPRHYLQTTKPTLFLLLQMKLLQTEYLSFKILFDSLCAVLHLCQRSVVGWVGSVTTPPGLCRQKNIVLNI